MICGPALSSLPHPPHTRAISHSPLPAYQPATTSHHGLNTSKLSTTSSTLSSTFILDYQHHPRLQVVTPHRASVITLETAVPTFQIFTHLSLGTRHYTLAVITRRRNLGIILLFLCYFQISTKVRELEEFLVISRNSLFVTGKVIILRSILASLQEGK